MAYLQYDPEGDWRGCIGARFYPLPSIMNADAVGLTVSIAGES